MFKSKYLYHQDHCIYTEKGNLNLIDGVVEELLK